MVRAAFFYCYAVRRNAECRYAECHYRDCRDALCWAGPKVSNLMNENIRTAVEGGDEAPALGHVEPLASARAKFWKQRIGL
jgi:hypothetical protein